MMNKKKVLILSLLSNITKYIRESNIVKNTWGKEILMGNYDNMQLFFFMASENGTEYIDYDSNIIYVNADDGFWHTGEKQCRAFKVAINFFDFDYVIVTNTATVLNLKLINEFVNSDFIDEDLYYGGNFILQLNTYPFFRGDFILLSRKNVMNIINNSEKVNFETYFANDMFIFNALMHYDLYSNIFLSKFRCVKCIDKFENEFSLNQIGSNFYINTKMKDTKNPDLVICNVVGAYSLLNSDKKKYDIIKDNLVHDIDIVETVSGRFKIEKIS